MCAPSHFYNGYNCTLSGGQGVHWGNCPNYFAYRPSCYNKNISCAFEFVKDNDMACEGQNTVYKCMKAMIHTFLEREYNFEKDADSSMPMQLSTPQEEMVEEEISSSKNEPKYLYDQNKNCGIEEEQQFEEEISSSQKKEVKEILRT
ncbi:hypothetical protein HAX54_015066 [Datura stramonium]|uniref:Uncharacterized protein n=1 Tax=Datura stramonium TaxID=4076 RepID=A0ABS8TP71_DATST|nr:hypothetical protein [Datura stramonium]